MANLFPETDVSAVVETAETADVGVRFGRSWKFDYDRGEFALTPTGKTVRTSDTDAWLEWCKKALHTERYRYLAYSRNYGQEFESLIGQALTRPAIESEIVRIASETLLADERTADVRGFRFEWDGDVCKFSCEVINVRDESGTIEGSVVNG